MSINKLAPMPPPPHCFGEAAGDFLARCATATRSRQLGEYILTSKLTFLLALTLLACGFGPTLGGTNAILRLLSIAEQAMAKGDRGGAIYVLLQASDCVGTPTASKVADLPYAELSEVIAVARAEARAGNPTKAKALLGSALGCNVGSKSDPMAIYKELKKRCFGVQPESSLR